MMVCVCLRSMWKRCVCNGCFFFFVRFFFRGAKGRRKNCWNFIRVICRQFSHTLRLAMARIFFSVFRCRSVRSFLGSVRFFVFLVCLVYRVFGSHLHYPHLTTGGFFHLLSSMQYDSLHRIANPTIEQCRTDRTTTSELCLRWSFSILFTVCIFHCFSHKMSHFFFGRSPCFFLDEMKWWSNVKRGLTLRFENKNVRKTFVWISIIAKYFSWHCRVGNGHFFSFFASPLRWQRH